MIESVQVSNRHHYYMLLPIVTPMILVTLALIGASLSFWKNGGGNSFLLTAFFGVLVFAVGLSSYFGKTAPITTVLEKMGQSEG